MLPSSSDVPKMLSALACVAALFAASLSQAEAHSASLRAMIKKADALSNVCRGPMNNRSQIAKANRACDESAELVRQLTAVRLGTE